MFDRVIQIVSPDEVRVVSWLGSIPPEDGGFPHFTSAIAEPGPHIFLPGSEVVGRVTTKPFEIHLFRHDTSTNGDYAELELGKLTLSGKVKVTARIGNGGKINRSDFWKAHFNSQHRDPLQHAETLLNPAIKSVLQGLDYNFRPDDNVDDIQISTISPSQFLTKLGLKREAQYLTKDDSSSLDQQQCADYILEQLEFIGMRLLNISIEDIALPEEVKAALNSISVANAQQAANLATAKGEADVIEQQNENKRKIAEGLATALQTLANADAGGSPIGLDKAFMAQVGIPGMKEVVGQNDKFFVSGIPDLLKMLNPGKS
jgi:regulator of protease activity HflC (stomatin/prohibitin superfamily)